MTKSTTSGGTLYAGDLSDGLDPEIWQIRGFDGLPVGDGEVTASAAGAVVRSIGRHVTTGEPQFARAPLGDAPESFVRWLCLNRHRATTDLPGFDTAPGAVLTASATLAPRFYGRPAGSPPDLSSLGVLDGGAVAMLLIDVESGLGLDLAVTDSTVYALYERLERPGSGHGAFLYAVPVAGHLPGQTHDLAVAVSTSGAGRADWYVDGDRVLRVDGLGLASLDPRHLVSSVAGELEVVTPRQFDLGLAVFASDFADRGVEFTARDVAVSIRCDL